VARTVCRRAERSAVRYQEEGDSVPPGILAYLNRASDLFWLFSRVLEVEAGVDSRLNARENQQQGVKVA
jgi:cob(I)alamin adenosyltransferase